MCVCFSVHFSFIASSFVEIQVVTPRACARGKVISLYVCHHCQHKNCQI